MQDLKNQSGFTAVDAVLTILLVMAIGLAGYFAYQNHQKSSPVAKVDSMTSPSPMPSPSTKLSSGTLATEKLHFSYPSNWALSNSTTDGAAPGVKSDQATISSPDGFTVSLKTGLTGLGGSCANCKLIKSEPVTAMGMQLFANFVSVSGDPNSFSEVELSTNNACTGICTIPDKNISYQGSPFDMLFSAGMGKNYGPTIPASQIATSSDVAAALNIFRSLTY